jgi:glycosyltransferase involved in cell wall biosynthesis
MVAVQLRAASNGEASATVAACFAAGTPVVATDVGWTRELPDAVVEKVERGIDPNQLAERILDLIDDEAERRTLTAAAADYARRHSFRNAAEALFEAIMAYSSPGRARAA